MNHSSERIASLIFKHLGEEELNEAELAELNAWKAASINNEALLTRYTSEEGLRQAILSHQEAKDRHWAYLQAEIAKQKPVASVEETLAPVRSVRRWGRLAIAASITGLLCLGTYFTFFHSKQSSDAGQPVVTGPYQNDVDPGKEKAYLVLADGQKVALEDAPNGELAQQGSVRIAKHNGVISYKNTGGSTGDVLMNTLVVPKGGVFQLLLPDGSHVWVNSASTLQYPTVFDDNKRLVKLDGEAYFEISHLTGRAGKRIPFMVDVNGSEVEVLGTHFNVMGYANEPSINTTLLSGSVRVIKGDHQKILTPGQQGRVDQQGKVSVLSSVDTDEVLAWKNGRFKFSRLSLEAIMREVERWYDVEVEYKDKIPDVFVGEIERNVQVSQILKLLELTELVHFKIEGKKIIVMQGKP